MDIYKIISLLGIPSLIVAFTRYLQLTTKKIIDDNKAVKTGVQALLRSQMIADYNKYSKKGYAPVFAKQNFENCWQQYHNLGANGVMDCLHDKFLELDESENIDND